MRSKLSHENKGSYKVMITYVQCVPIQVPRVRACTHIRTHARMHVHTHTHTCARTRTRTHTHKPTHKQASKQASQHAHMHAHSSHALLHINVRRGELIAYLHQTQKANFVFKKIFMLFEVVPFRPLRGITLKFVQITGVKCV